MLKFISVHLEAFIAICLVLAFIEILFIIFLNEKSKVAAIISLVITVLFSIVSIAVSLGPDNSDSAVNPTPVIPTSSTAVSTDSNVTNNESELEPKETPSEGADTPVEFGTPFVTVSPDNQITNAHLSKWDEETDRDIVGNTYSAAMKLSVSNMIDAMTGGRSDISAEVHLPYGGKCSDILIVSFVVAKDMVGNGSSAEITIKSDGEAMYPAFTLESTTTDEISYEVDLTAIRDLVLEFNCTSVDSGFCAGIILEGK